MTDTNDLDDEVIKLGAQIKARRTELNLSLRDVAAATGLSPTFLSNLERGMANPTLDSLRKVSNALSMPILRMVPGLREFSPVVRRDLRRQINLVSEHIRYEILTPTLNKKMVLFQATVTAEDGNVVVGSLAEPTEECIVVLKGKLSIGIDEQIYELGEGDSVYFEGRSLTHLSVLGEGEATFISAITPPVF